MKFTATEHYLNTGNYMDYNVMARKAQGTCTRVPIAHKCYILKHKTTFKTETGEQVGEPGMVAIIGDDHAWPVTIEYFKKHYTWQSQTMFPEVLGE